MKKPVLYLLLAVFTYPAFCTGNEYDVRNIDPGLKRNASAIVRKDQTHITANSNRGRATVLKNYAITILNESGKNHDIIYAEYFENREIKNLKATLYDSTGQKLVKFRGRNFDDYSLAWSFDEYSNFRVKVLNPLELSYPYTIEFEIELRYKGYLMLPGWDPVSAVNVSVENSSYIFEVPSGTAVIYKEINCEGLLEKTEKGNKDIYQWEIKSFMARKREYFTPPAESYVPRVLCTTEKFVLEGYPGSFQSWNTFAEWINKLNEGREILPVVCRRKVREMTDSIEDPFKKVQVLYDYLQSTTHYVNIQFGIGGYQPISAQDVYLNGYGDCKALTNYMKALLKVAGIPSIYTLVRAGNPDNPFYSEFPSQQFNHVILCVPLEKDTLWLECTNQRVPMGYIANATDNREVLLVTDKGGKLVRTKIYPAENNRQIQVAKLSYDYKNRKFNCKINTTYSGKQYDIPLSLMYESPNEQEKIIRRSLGIHEFSLIRYRIRDSLINEEPAGIIDLELELKHYLSGSGKRYFLNLNLLNKYENFPPEVEERQHEIYIPESYFDVDSIEFLLPSETIFEFIPVPVNFSGPFGTYSSKVMLNGSRITYIRKLTMKKGIYPPEMYGDFKEFFRKIVKADKAGVLFHLPDPPVKETEKPFRENQLVLKSVKHN